MKSYQLQDSVTLIATETVCEYYKVTCSANVCNNKVLINPIMSYSPTGIFQEDYCHYYDHPIAQTKVTSRL